MATKEPTTAEEMMAAAELNAEARIPDDPIERLFFFESVLRSAARRYEANKVPEMARLLRQAAVRYARAEQVISDALDRVTKAK